MSDDAITLSSALFQAWGWLKAKYPEGSEEAEIAEVCFQAQEALEEQVEEKAALRAANERLRALLSEVVNYFQGGIMPRDLHDWRERSRAALADQGEGDGTVTLSPIKLAEALMEAGQTKLADQGKG